jgi:hypothetical protein
MKILIPALLCLFVGCGQDKAPDNKPEVTKTDDKPAAQPDKKPEPDKEPEPAKPAIDSEYAKDVDRICNAIKYSGAEGIEDTNERVIKMAEWLKKNLKTPEATKLMQSFASMVPEQRETFLRSEAKKAGLDGCALADSDGK